MQINQFYLDYRRQHEDDDFLQGREMKGTIIKLLWFNARTKKAKGRLNLQPLEQGHYNMKSEVIKNGIL